MSSFKSAENKEPSSSQDIPSSDAQSSLSPQRPPPSTRENGRKERRNPSITPRKFGRFFTPRSQASKHPSPGRQALNDIATPPNNRRGLSSPIRFTIRGEKDENPSTIPTRNSKKRKLTHTPEATPDHIYAESKEHEEFETLRDENAHHDLQNIQSSPCERAANVGQDQDEHGELLQRIIPIDQRGIGGRLLQSMSGLPTRSRRQRYAYPVNGKASLNLIEEPI